MRAVVEERLVTVNGHLVRTHGIIFKQSNESECNGENSVSKEAEIPLFSPCAVFSTRPPLSIPTSEGDQRIYEQYMNNATRNKDSLITNSQLLKTATANCHGNGKVITCESSGCFTVPVRYSHDVSLSAKPNSLSPLSCDPLQYDTVSTLFGTLPGGGVVIVESRASETSGLDTRFEDEDKLHYLLNEVKRRVAEGGRLNSESEKETAFQSFPVSPTFQHPTSFETQKKTNVKLFDMRSDDVISAPSYAVPFPGTPEFFTHTNPAVPAVLALSSAAVPYFVNRQKFNYRARDTLFPAELRTFKNTQESKASFPFKLDSLRRRDIVNLVRFHSIDVAAQLFAVCESLLLPHLAPFATLSTGLPLWHGAMLDLNVPLPRYLTKRFDTKGTVGGAGRETYTVAVGAPFSVLMGKIPAPLTVSNARNPSLKPKIIPKRSTIPNSYIKCINVLVTSLDRYFFSLYRISFDIQALLSIPRKLYELCEQKSSSEGKDVESLYNQLFIRIRVPQYAFPASLIIKIEFYLGIELTDVILYLEEGNNVLKSLSLADALRALFRLIGTQLGSGDKVPTRLSSLSKPLLQIIPYIVATSPPEVAAALREFAFGQYESVREESMIHSPLSISPPRENESLPSPMITVPWGRSSDESFCHRHLLALMLAIGAVRFRDNKCTSNRCLLRHLPECFCMLDPKPLSTNMHRLEQRMRNRNVVKESQNIPLPLDSDKQSARLEAHLGSLFNDPSLQPYYEITRLFFAPHPFAKAIIPFSSEIRSKIWDNYRDSALAVVSWQNALRIAMLEMRELYARLHTNDQGAFPGGPQFYALLLNEFVPSSEPSVCAEVALAAVVLYNMKNNNLECKKKWSARKGVMEGDEPLVRSKKRKRESEEENEISVNEKEQ